MYMLIKYEGVVNVFNENIHKSHFWAFSSMSTVSGNSFLLLTYPRLFKLDSFDNFGNSNAFNSVLR